MSEEFEVKEPCPCCGKADLLMLRPCVLGPQYSGDVLCKRCGVKISVAKWNIRAPNPQVAVLRKALNAGLSVIPSGWATDEQYEARLQMSNALAETENV